ncbi:co-chaperone GroES [Candidatus Azambacteria bacterium]|nr:co-chaperone GroES [Candidatus Azambacteria bacterium]
MNLRPLSDHLILEQLTKEEKSLSGIILPDSMEKEKSQQGLVIAVGPGKTLENGQVRELSIKVGQKVLFTKYGPNEVKIKDDNGKEKEYLVAREEDILAIIE